ncbi:MAG: anti-sigma factor domain-containing protein [Solirubrobacteraceae bacterium]
MSTDDRQRCDDNAAPYVLGALEEHEHEQFSRHLESCAVCREEVAALEVVTGALPAAVEYRGAPPELKQRVMASVHEDLRSQQAHEPVRAHTRFSRRGAAAWLRWRALAPGALVAAAIVLAVVVFSAGGGSATTHVFHAQAPAGAEVLLRVSDDRGQLEISGMPQTPPQRIYEVWIKRAGGPQPTDALFTVTSKGDATVVVPTSLKGATAVMVTAEPLGGTNVPTSAPVIVANLT